MILLSNWYIFYIGYGYFFAIDIGDNLILKQLDIETTRYIEITKLIILCCNYKAVIRHSQKKTRPQMPKW